MESDASATVFSLPRALAYCFVAVRSIPYRGHLANYHQYLAFGLLQAAYNCYLHPLAKIPGPKLRAAFYFPSYWEIWTGDMAYNWHGLHENYGDVVRIAPDFVSVIKAEGWRGRIAYISSSC